MGMKIETPPVFTGADAGLQQVYAYLYRLSEHLNLALSALSEERGAETALSVPTAPQEAQVQSANALRGLVVNTAAIIRKEMDALETALHGEYEAISEEWGSFAESIDTKITETAREVVREYDYDSRLDALQAQATGFGAYQVRTEGFIRQGFVEYDDRGVPILGVAIGQNLSGNVVTVDGVDYEQFDKGQSCAFYTAEKVSFRINGQEVAYVSNRKLYIREAEITTGTVTLGGQWQLTTGKGFAVKWVGGED